MKGMHERNQKPRDGCRESSGVTKLTAPMDDEIHPKVLDQLPEEDQKDQWVETTVPKETVEKSMQRNQKHFGQARETPFNKPPLSVEIDYEASTRTVECTLDGEHNDTLLEECGQLKEVMTDFIDNVERERDGRRSD